MTTTSSSQTCVTSTGITVPVVSGSNGKATTISPITISTPTSGLVSILKTPTLDRARSEGSSTTSGTASPKSCLKNPTLDGLKMANTMTIPGTPPATRQSILKTPSSDSNKTICANSVLGTSTTLISSPNGKTPALDIPKANGVTNGTNAIIQTTAGSTNTTSGVTSNLFNHSIETSSTNAVRPNSLNLTTTTSTVTAIASTPTATATVKVTGDGLLPAVSVRKVSSGETPKLIISTPLETIVENVTKKTFEHSPVVNGNALSLRPAECTISVLPEGNLGNVSTEILDAVQSIGPVPTIAEVEAIYDNDRRTSLELLEAIMDSESPVLVPVGDNNLRRVASNVTLVEITDIPIPPKETLRKTSSVTELVQVTKGAQKVRFFLGGNYTNEDLEEEESDSDSNMSRSRLSVFKDLFRGSSRRGKKKKKAKHNKDDLPDDTSIDGFRSRSNSGSKLLKTFKKHGSSNSRDSANSDEPPGMSRENSFDALSDYEVSSPGERQLWANMALKSQNFHHRRSHSTKSRHKRFLSSEDEDDEDGRDFAHSATESSILQRGSSLIMRLRHRHGNENWSYPDLKAPDHDSDGVENGDEQDENYFQKRRERGSRRSRRKKAPVQYENTHAHYHGDRSCYRCHPTTLKEHVLNIIGHFHPHERRRKRRPFMFSSPERNSYGRIVGHSLASVELGSWAARGSRRGSVLPPFCATLSPTEATSRSEILQTISSSIIHLFQRKALKDNELGALQEHVRFLINSEAGGLVHEYYKDQLLRKGMIILREKIKNEQGLELLRQLGETWDYFFKEILPSLQAILYPLSSLLGKDESVRSLSLLAFRNIVVLKVSVKEALDSVEKDAYPPSIQQMLLVLQSIQDNVFLSENQFLLEKLVARVVCPYLGQRGVYEGSPDPVIKVKLKPIPINIPNVVVSENKLTSLSRLKLESQTYPSPMSPRKGGLQDGVGMKKLKPVLEHVYDGGRRHSIMS